MTACCTRGCGARIKGCALNCVMLDAEQRLIPMSGKRDNQGARAHTHTHLHARKRKRNPVCPCLRYSASYTTVRACKTLLGARPRAAWRWRPTLFGATSFGDSFGYRLVDYVQPCSHAAAMQLPVDVCIAASESDETEITRVTSQGLELLTNSAL